MKLLLAANWKMNKSRSEAEQTLLALKGRLDALPNEREVAVFAPFTALADCAKALAGSPIALGGQNCYPAGQGAFTGEISPPMLLDCGCSYVLVGHSERRALMGESDALICRKVAHALDSGLKVVLCIGETLEERDDGQLVSVLSRQIMAGLAQVDKATPAANISIAYEPVWAIGTGRVAGAEAILEAHALVRKNLLDVFSAPGNEMRILYGGSAKADNAKAILALDNVNGLLVGGASLDAESFSRIALA